MTKVLHIITSADPTGGGPIEAARVICETWMKSGHSHDLLTLDPQDSDKFKNFPGKVFKLGEEHRRSLSSRYRYSKNIVPWLLENSAKYDAVLISGLWRYQTKAALTALRKTRVPYFVFTHGMLDPWFRRTYPLKHLLKQISWWWSEGPLLRGARAVLFTTEEERVVSDRAFWPYSVREKVISYGTSDVPSESELQVTAFREAHPKFSDRPFLLFLSRIHRKKGCDLLVDGFGLVAQQYPDLNLVIAGPDQEGLVEVLHEKAIKLGIADRVHFPGMLQDAVKYGAYRSSQAFILVSHQENFGIVVAEAMACSKAVLISNKVNIWREIEEDNAGFVSPDTVEGARDLIVSFMSLTHEQRRQIQDNARSSFLRRFLIEESAIKLMQFIEEEVLPSRQ